MGNTVAFGTQATVKELEVAGFSKRLAETLIQQYMRFINGHLVAKTDVAAIQRNIKILRRDDGTLRQETKRNIIESEHLIVIRLRGMVIVAPALLATIQIFA